MTPPGFFSFSNFRAFISLSDLLLFRMSVIEIDPQCFKFKTSQFLGESVSPKFVYIPFLKTFV